MKHDQVTELLPWYLNGTLEADEQGSVEEHLEDCEECTRQLAEFRALGAAAAERAEETPDVPEGLFARVLADIDTLEAESPAVEIVQESPEGLLTRVMQAFEAWWQPLTRPTRLALVVQSLALIATIGLLASNWPGAGPVVPDTLQTATGQDVSAASDRARVLVGFQDGVTELAMRELLGEIDARIVFGPSSIGLYTLELPIAGGDLTGVATLLDQLRERTELIRFAEPER